MKLESKQTANINETNNKDLEFSLAMERLKYEILLIKNKYCVNM